MQGYWEKTPSKAMRFLTSNQIKDKERMIYKSIVNFLYDRAENHPRLYCNSREILKGIRNDDYLPDEVLEEYTLEKLKNDLKGFLSNCGTVRVREDTSQKRTLANYKRSDKIYSLSIEAKIYWEARLKIEEKKKKGKRFRKKTLEDLLKWAKKYSEKRNIWREHRHQEKKQREIYNWWDKLNLYFNKVKESLEYIQELSVPDLSTIIKKEVQSTEEKDFQAFNRETMTVLKEFSEFYHERREECTKVFGVIYQDKEFIASAVNQYITEDKGRIQIEDEYGTEDVEAQLEVIISWFYDEDSFTSAASLGNSRLEVIKNTVKDLKEEIDKICDYLIRNQNKSSGQLTWRKIAELYNSLSYLEVKKIAGLNWGYLQPYWLVDLGEQSPRYVNRSLQEFSSAVTHQIDSANVNSTTNNNRNAKPALTSQELEKEQKLKQREKERRELIQNKLKEFINKGEIKLSNYIELEYYTFNYLFEMILDAQKFANASEDEFKKSERNYRKEGSIKFDYQITKLERQINLQPYKVASNIQNMLGRLETFDYKIEFFKRDD